MLLWMVVCHREFQVNDQANPFKSIFVVQNSETSFLCLVFCDLSCHNLTCWVHEQQQLPTQLQQWTKQHNPSVTQKRLGRYRQQANYCSESRDMRNASKAQINRGRRQFGWCIDVYEESSMSTGRFFRTKVKWRGLLWPKKKCPV